jgi:lipoprotein YgeR
VGEGSYVEQGQPIANINQASTGNPTEINFKIYVKDKPINPLAYLP